MEIFKNVMLVLLGVVLAVGLFCVTVAIGCAINGISFGQQITQWFGESAPALDVAAHLIANKPII